MKKLLEFWMATDFDNWTWLYKRFPIKKEHTYQDPVNKTGSYFSLHEKNINGQTFEDSPIKVSLIIEDKL